MSVDIHPQMKLLYNSRTILYSEPLTTLHQFYKQEIIKQQTIITRNPIDSNLNTATRLVTRPAALAPILRTRHWSPVKSTLFSRFYSTHTDALMAQHQYTFRNSFKCINHHAPSVLNSCVVHVAQHCCSLYRSLTQVCICRSLTLRH